MSPLRDIRRVLRKEEVLNICGQLELGRCNGVTILPSLLEHSSLPPQRSQDYYQE